MSIEGAHKDEELPPHEAHDMEEIRERMRVAQKQRAEQDNRALGRGTHTKGICVGAEFEVFDLATTIADEQLRKRLSHGLFTKPGTYDATVRFANGQTRVLEDSKPDVRAMSFSVHFKGDPPVGLKDPRENRIDFSMNNATTFPWNDAHAFALLVRLTTATGVLGRLKAVATLSPVDVWIVVKTLVRIKRQMKKPALPYQAMRYWSTVPFQHGGEEVMKYSATPDPRNRQTLPAPSANMLREELVRHVTKDKHEEMSSFVFGIQLLDERKMRHRWRRRQRSFWVENASIEWKESPAPFYPVGRLTLKKDSVLPPEDCDKQYMDVTCHRALDGRPIGGINRARWYAEEDSRKARMGEQLPLLPHGSRPSTWVRRLTLESVLRSVAFVAGFGILLVTLLAGATSIYLDMGGKMPGETATSVSYPDQGWGAGVEAPDRQVFYYTSQGAGLKNMRYSWFVHLEEPWGEGQFSDLLDQYGFLIDDETPRNPDGLPVGFTKHFDRELREELLDITCAACHTGQIHVTRGNQRRALRIDGGQADHAFTDASFGNFLPTMMSSMANTYINPLKFARFARKELGPQYPKGLWELRAQFRNVLWGFVKLGATEKIKGLSPAKEGYGRTDALTRISNTVFAENLSESNYQKGTGPVSFPSVWNIYKFDWVQYNASVSQPMARNIGEAMGVGAKYALVDKYGRPLPPNERFRSTARIHDLDTIEHTLQRLKQPVWQADILGPVDSARARAGKVLFTEHCQGCHGPHKAPDAIRERNSPLKGDSVPEWLMKWLCITDIGTDPNAGNNFVKATVDISRTGLTASELRAVARVPLQEWTNRQRKYLAGEVARLQRYPDSLSLMNDYKGQLKSLDDEMAQKLSGINPRRLPVGAALSYLGTMIRNMAYDEAGIDSATRPRLDGFGTLDLPQVLPAYKARPLGGVWATPPFLHNGSVPTIYDLLSPVAQRPTSFRVGSREYDYVRLGLFTPDSGKSKDQDRPTRKDFKEFDLFETSGIGNANTGHEFNGDGKGPGIIGRKLTEDEKMAILEHLKVRDDDQDGDPTPRIPRYPSCPGPK